MADLRKRGPLADLINDETVAPNSTLLEPDADFVPNVAQTNVGGDFEMGLQSGSLGVEAGHFYRQADFAERDGKIDDAVALRSHAKRLEAEAAGFAPRVGSSSEVESFGDAIDFAQSGFGQLAPTMAATSLPGIIGGVAGGILTGGNPLGIAAGAGLAAGYAGFDMEAGEAAQAQQADPEIAKLSVEERLREQSIKGAQAAALELIFPAMVGGRLAGSVSKIFKKLGKQGLKETAEDAAKAAKRLDITKKAGRVNLAEATGEGAYTVLKETGAEAGTEASQTLVGQASLNRLNPLRDRSGDVQELIDATILGGLGGGGMSISTTVPGALVTGAKDALKSSTEIDEDGNIKPGAGQRIRDSIIGAAQDTKGAAQRVADATIDAGKGVIEGVATRVKDTDIPFIAENVGKAAKEKVGEVVDAVKESDAGFIAENVAKKAKETASKVGEKISDSEIARRARLRKSAFTPGARAELHTEADVQAQQQEDAAAMDDFAASSRFEKSAEEIVGLRELDPISKEKGKGQRQYVRATEVDVNAHLTSLVTRGVITQEVADTAKAEGLGTKMKREGASVQEMENEISGIVRDIMRRIEDNRKKGGSKTEVADRNKALENELASLPIDVTKRGESTKVGPTTTELVETTEQQKLKKKGGAAQQELFPEDVGQSFPVKLKEFRKNHFGVEFLPSVMENLNPDVKQGELDLGKTNRKELLAKALDQYVTILASDAAVESSAATVEEHKGNRAKYEQADQETKNEMAAKGQILRLEKQNGQAEIIDVESIAAEALKKNREAITGGIRSDSKAQEAAVLEGLAKELLRNDIKGLQVRNPKTGKTKVITGTQANTHAAQKLREWLKGKPQAVRGLANQERRATGKYTTKAVKEEEQEQAIIESPKRANIQKGFNQTRKRLQSDRAISSKAAKSFKLTDKPSKVHKEGLTEAEVLKGWKRTKAKFKKAAAAQRKILADLRKMQQEYFANKHKGPDLTVEEKLENKQLLGALELKYGFEATELYHNKPMKGTAAFRADRLEALVADIDRMIFAVEKEQAQVALGAEGQPGGQARNTEPTGVRHAAEPTGADKQIPVNQRFGGKNKQQQVSKRAAARLKQQRKHLATRIGELKSLAAVRDLLAKSLGYKSIQDGLFDVGGPIIFLGKLAKERVMKAAQKQGMNVVSTDAAVEGQRVTVLIAKGDTTAVLKSKGFNDLLASGAEIVTPILEPRLRKEMMNNGYKPHKRGGIEVWVPTLASDGGSSVRFMAGRFGKPNPLQVVMTPGYIASVVEEVLGKEAMANIDFKYSDEAQAGVSVEEIRDAGDTIGVYSLRTGRITLFVDKIYNEQQIKWVVWHESFHRGLDAKFDGLTRGFLKRAADNKTVDQIATRIQDSLGITDNLTGTEEALAEIAAAIRMGPKLGAAMLEEQYNVKIDPSLLTGKGKLMTLVQEWFAMIREIFGYVSDVEIHGMIQSTMKDRNKAYGGSQAWDVVYDSPIDTAIYQMAKGEPLWELLAKQIMKTGTMTHRPAMDKAIFEASIAFSEGKGAEVFEKYKIKVTQDQVGNEFFEVVQALLDQAQEKEFKSLRFSRKTQKDGKATPLTDAQRAYRRKQIMKYLTRVLGPEIAAKFEDVLTEDMVDGAAATFDWKTSVVQVAIDMVGFMGAAKHESFHAFFHNMGKMKGSRQVYNRLLKAANAPHIMKQLKVLLKDSPEALEQLKDPEERLAYMFQFYADKRLNLTPKTRSTFAKWARKFGELVGMISTMESAERIFEQLESGNLNTNWKVRDMIQMESSTKLAAAIQSVLYPIQDGFRAVLTTATDRLRHTNNPSLAALADLFAPEILKGGAAGFIARRGQSEGQWRNRMNDIFDKYQVEGETTQESLARERKVMRALQGQEDSTDPMVLEIREFMQDMYVYLRDPDGDTYSQDGLTQTVSPNAVQYISEWIDGEAQWVPIGDEGPKYFPRNWDPTAILENWDEFVKAVEDAGGPAVGVLQDFKSALMAGDGLMEWDANNSAFDHAMKAVNPRTFDFINESNAKLFVQFQEQNMEKMLTQYIRSATHRAEQTRHFGHDNRKIHDLLKEARESGASEDDMVMAEKAVRALEGSLGTESMTPMKKNIMMGAMTAVNLAVLPLALMSSLVDPLGVMVRTGNAVDAYNTFIAGTKQIVADIRGNKTRGQQVAEFLGVVEQEQMLAVTGDSYNHMFMNETLRKINARFFKLIGLDSWTKGTRIGAMVAGMLYLRDNMDNKKALAELGLKKGDIVMVQERMPDGRLGEKTVVETRPEVLGDEKARRVQEAIYRMVDESILRPTASQRPIFMSDMRFMLLGHLKQFTFSFHNTIVKQVAARVSEQLDNKEYGKAMVQFMPLLMYVPMMMAADFLRAVIGGRLDDDDDEENKLLKAFGNGVQRSGVLGVASFGYDAAEETFGYDGIPINTFLGPVIDKAIGLGEAAVDADTNFLNAGKRMLPGYAFWKGWMQ